MSTNALFDPRVDNLGLPEIWTFEVATPLHIGSGEKLSYQAYDFRFDGGRMFYPDLAALFPQGGITPKQGIKWDKDGIPGSPCWSDWGVAPELVPASGNGRPPDDGGGEPSGKFEPAKPTPASTVEELLIAAETHMEAAKAIGFDQKFPQHWASCGEDDFKFMKLLRDRDKVRQCPNLPESWDREQGFIDYWRGLKSAKHKSPTGRAAPKGATAEEDCGNFADLNELHQFIRDGFGNPYIPGSSLKGSLRTVLQANRDKLAGDKRIENMRRPPDKNDQRDRGGGLTGDLGRLFQVCDAALSPLALGLYRISVVSKGKPGAPIKVEALLPGAKFAASIRVDASLKKAKAHGKLKTSFNRDQVWQLEQEEGKNGWHALRGMLKSFNEAVAGYQAAGLDRRAEKSQDEDGRRALRQAAEWLKSTVLESPGGYLQLGFGSGWSGMTGIPAMYDDEKKIIENANKIGNRFYKSRLKDGSYGPGNPFPLSFRLVHTPEGWRPMGWVKLVEVRNFGA
ncbi:MAG: type III-A CRISPR-associated RAMP protein Csm5 [bacterium]|jgi:CRISPR type III-A-associated RAMP protein Csm5